MLGKFEKLNHRISNWFEWVGLVGLLLMMVITCVDVVGAKVFKMPVFGALDIIQLSQIVATSFACAFALILGKHIQVDFVFSLLSRRAQAMINRIVYLIGLGLFIVIIWRLCVLGYSFQSSGEYSMTAYIPYYPFAYGMALASIPVCLVFLVKFLKSLTKGEQK